MGVTITDVKNVITNICKIVIKNKKYFCELDSVAGDGDFGMSLSKGFNEIQKQIESTDSSTIDRFIMGCSLIITEHSGGATGPIWGSGFRAAAKSVQGKETLELTDVAEMFIAAAEGIQKRGSAKLGDKTLIDALIPAANALVSAASENMTFKDAFKMAAKSAYEGAELTKTMVANRGRATYLGKRSLTHPDPGAMAISVLFISLMDGTN